MKSYFSLLIFRGGEDVTDDDEGARIIRGFRTTVGKKEGDQVKVGLCNDTDENEKMMMFRDDFLTAS